jgi:alpha-glucosidase
VSRTAPTTSADTEPAGPPEPAPTDWWRHAVFYQVYPRSFADSNGDGIGDLEGVRSRLDYLQLLGVDALWLSPFYESPMADHGYDVSDPRQVDPIFGTLDDFDALIRDSHERGIKVTIDVVPNHFSDQHPWFIAARTAAPEQPDLNWDNAEVIVEFAEIFKFWLDRGVDGFRIDVAHGMAKPEGLPDLEHIEESRELTDQINGDLRWDQDGVHEIHRGFRRVLDAYPGTMAVGEAWVPDDSRLALYVRPDELHLTFNFELVTADWGAAQFRSAINDSILAMAEVGAPCSWVLSNHDVERHVSRYGGGAVGLARGRAAALLQLALPGAAYLYNGDELGLENAELPDWALQDPTWERSGHVNRGRDGERVPIPWEGSAAPYGFTSGASTWLPMPPDWASVTAEAELGDAASTLSMYRHALELRHDLADLRGSGFGWQGAPSGCLAFRRGPQFICAVNFSDRAVALPPGRLLLSSSPSMDLTAPGSVLPANTAVWLRA